MKKLINDTAYTKVTLSTNEYLMARDLITRGKVKDCLGDTLSATEVTDSDGDLRVDEDMYEELCFALGKKSDKL